ncbi:hypothetical protein [Pseudomonas orientalis]|uniref:Lipoprotein n=1 Tax=Pseudomonas orientalis TaxID=76758 RepID=A0A4Q7D394_9PSED|nr:hypothetical protein [Pseudomonas orientalis]RZI33335.1 hypothetical protein EUX57_02750 [Pseudomonas orientalis]
MQILKLSINVMLMGALAGCSAITYHKSFNEDREGYTKFELQSSAIRLDRTEPAKGESVNVVAGTGAVNSDKGDKTATAAPAGKLVLTSVPTASSAHRYAIESTDYWFWRTTHLGITKRPDTDQIQAVTINTEDNLVKLIENVGAAGVGLVGLLAFTGEVVDTTTALPDAIDLEPELTARAEKRNEVIKIPLIFAGGIAGDVFIEPVARDAIETTKFLANDKTKSDVLIYSACRKATVVLKEGNETLRWAVVVADPNYVQTLKLPEKGKMTAHPGCGFDSSSDPSSVASASAVFNEIVGQTKAIIDAKKAAKKAAAGGGG